MANKAKIGASIVLDGEKEFKSAVTACNKKLATMRSELGLVKEKYAENANSLTALQDKHKVLSNILNIQKSKQESVRIGLENAQKSQQKVAESLGKLKSEYQQAQKSMDKMKASCSSTDKEIAEQEKKLKELAQAIEKGEHNYDSASKRVDSWRTQLNRAQTQVLKANRAVQQNEKYMHEAENATDQCAKSLDQYGKKTKNVVAETNTFKDSLRANLASNLIGKAISSTKTAITTVGQASVASAKNVGLYADDMNTLSTQTGVATDTLQELKYMEDLVDVSLEQVTGSMAKNIKSMSKAKAGSATYVKAYERLAVSVTDANGNLRDSEDVYWDVIDALGNVANETERNSLAMTIFGKSAQTLNPLIAQGSAGINELKKEAQSVGAVLSQDTLDAMNAVNDQFDRLSAQSDALKREIGVELAPSILSAATEIGTAIQENKEDLINLASGGIDVVTTGMTWIIEHAQGVVAGVTAIGGAMLTLKAASKAMDVVGGISSIASLANPIGIAVVALGTLATAVVALKTATSKESAEERKERQEFDATVSAMRQKNETIQQTIKSSKEKIQSSESEAFATEQQAKRLMELNKVENKSKAQKNEMKTLVQSLSSQIPGITKSYDEQTGTLKMSNKEIEKQIKNWKQLYLTQALQDDLKDIYKAQYDAQKNIENANQAITDSQQKVTDAYKEATEAQKALNKEYEENKNNPNYNENYSKTYQNALYKERQYLKTKEQEKENRKKLRNEIKKYNQTLSDCNQEVDRCQKYANKLNAEQEKQNKSSKAAAKSTKKAADQYSAVAKGFQKAEQDIASIGGKTSKKSKQQFEQAVKVAKETGTKIPKGLANGLKSGAKSPDDAVKSINNAVVNNLTKLAKKARQSGVAIPKEITDGMKNGTMSVSKASRLINAQIDKQSKASQKNMEKAYLKVPKNMKSAFEKGGADALNAIQKSKEQIKALEEEAGVSSVDGLIKGLNANKARVVKAYEDLGKSADSGFRKALKIHSPSRVMEEDGEYTGDGVVKGLNNRKKAVGKAGKELGNAVDESIRSSLDIHSPSKKTEKSGKNAGDGLNKGLKKTKKNLKKTANELGQEMISALESKIEMKDLRTNGHGYSKTAITKKWKDVVKETKKGTQAHKDALKQYYTARNELLNAQQEKNEKYQEKMKTMQSKLKEIRSNYKETIKDLQSQMAEVKKEYADAVSDTASSISSSWGLFAKASTSKTNNADGLIRNMKTQAETVKQWKTNMDALRKRGVSGDLLKDLESAGVSSAGDVSTLAAMSDAQLSQYKKYYSQRNATAKQEAVTENAALQKSTQAQLASLQKATKQQVKQQQQQLQNLQKQYNKLKKSVASLDKSTQKQMRQLGKNVSQGFAKGIASGSEAVYKSIAGMTGTTVKQVKKNLGIHSPSRVMAKLGGYTGAGFAQGLEKETQDLHNIILNSLPKKVDAPVVSATNVQPNDTSAQEIYQRPVELTLMMDSRAIAEATFNAVDLLSGGKITLKKRGLAL
jgi:hypothetical protein